MNYEVKCSCDEVVASHRIVRLVRRCRCGRLVDWYDGYDTQKGLPDD